MGLPGGVAGAAVCHGTAVDEQAWIAEGFREPILQPCVRVWIYRRPALVLGCSARPDAGLAERAAAAGMDVCVRPSGGGAVLAGPWLLGASVVLPAHDALVAASIPASFRWLGLAHAAWLQGLGIAAGAVPAPVAFAGAALRWSCFGGLSHWEVESHGRKIAGLAQARRRNGVLFSAGVLIEPSPWGSLCDVLGQPREDAVALAGRTVSCAERLDAPAQAATLAQSLLDRLSLLVGCANSETPG